MKDEDKAAKKLIWEDCPQCAYKHLTAAYAALTSPGVQRDWDAGVHEWEVYAARAYIVGREADTGYLGNRDLEAGCYAMAELCTPFVALRVTFHEARMAILEGRTATVPLPVPSEAAIAVAHIVEALREFPELTSRTYFKGPITGTQYQEVRELVRNSILWVKESYELCKEREVESVAS